MSQDQLDRTDQSDRTDLAAANREVVLLDTPRFNNKTPEAMTLKIKEINDEFMNEGESLLLDDLPKEILRLTQKIKVIFYFMFYV